MTIIRLVIIRSALVAGLICSSSQAHAADVSSWWKTRDQRGAELLQSGDAEAASEVFRNSEWRGISHYRNGNFAQAQKEFSGSSNPQSLYNEGTAAAKAGDFQAAIEKFEQVVEADPAHADAAHNLDITKQLLEKQQQSSNESEQGDEQNDEQGDSEESDGGEESGEQSQSGEQGDQQSGESQQSEDGGDQENSDNGGELSTTADDAEAKADENQNQAAQSASDQEQNEQQSDEEQAASAQAGSEQQGEPSDPAENADLTQAGPISESEQATEQWMRRIPDDPSQLLRNKIKLNHMIQHENVRDLAEPW